MYVCVSCRGQAATIKAGQIFGPADPTKPYSTVAIKDIADAAAAILANPAPHAGKTYSLASPAYTQTQLAAAFTASLGKPVAYIQVPYEAAKGSFISAGFQEWQVRACGLCVSVCICVCVMAFEGLGRDLAV